MCCYFNPQCNVTVVASGFIYKVLPEYSIGDCKYSTFDYNALVITLQTSVTITCGIQPTGVATMAIKAGPYTGGVRGGSFEPPLSCSSISNEWVVTFLTMQLASITTQLASIVIQLLPICK